MQVVIAKMAKKMMTGKEKNSPKIRLTFPRASFYRAHSMHGGIIHEISVRPFVRLSNL